MSLPTAQDVTNMYLYGQLTTPLPGELANDVWIRPDPLSASATPIIPVNATEYMQGPGRFALAAMSALVRDFFLYPGDIPGVVPGQEYSKAEMAAFLGLDSYGIKFQQYTYDDGAGDYGQRIYVWGSSAFQISDGARFVVDADGKRHIENLAIVPLLDPILHTPLPENFDFVSNNIYAVSQWNTSAKY